MMKKWRTARHQTRYLRVKNGCCSGDDDHVRTNYTKELLRCVVPTYADDSVSFCFDEKRTVFVEWPSVRLASIVHDALVKYRMYNGVPLIVGYSEPKNTSPNALLLNVDRSAPSISGLQIITDFIDEQTEAKLVDAIDTETWIDSVIQRRVQHYGYEFDYARRCVNVQQSVALPLPRFVAPIVEKLPAVVPTPDQLTINEYLPGQGIGMHIDTHSAFHDGFVSLSLLSDTVMMFRNAQRPNDEVTHVLLPRRSLVIFSGESRYAYEHGIRTRKSDRICGKVVPRQRRVSLTLRRVRTKDSPCTCSYPELCDSQLGHLKPTLLSTKHNDDPNAAWRVENEFVHRFYDRVAAHFSHTRHSPWPLVKEFVEQLPHNSTLADIGCGNGRHMMCAHHSVDTVGIDISPALVKVCRQRRLNVCVGDALYVPFRSESFDYVICIAVVHHLACETHRLRALRELIRISKDGATILVYGWAFEQDDTSRRTFTSQDCFVPWHLPSRFDPMTSQQNDGNNNNDTAVVQRYCHVYREGELDELCRKAVSDSGRRIVNISSYYDHSNWCVRFTTSII